MHDECVTVSYVILSLFNKIASGMKIDNYQNIFAKVSSAFFFLQKMVGSRKIMKIQGQLEGMIKESCIEGLAGMSD